MRRRRRQGTRRTKTNPLTNPLTKRIANSRAKKKARRELQLATSTFNIATLQQWRIDGHDGRGREERGGEGGEGREGGEVGNREVRSQDYDIQSRLSINRRSLLSSILPLLLSSLSHPISLPPSHLPPPPFLILSPVLPPPPLSLPKPTIPQPSTPHQNHHQNRTHTPLT